MIIRSQDKKRIVNFDNIEKIAIYGRFEDTLDDNPNYWTVETPTACLGRYTSEEKAVKALDEIETAAVVSELLKIPYGDGVLSAKVLDRMDNWAKEQFQHNFQMPQDDEVEV